MKIKLSDLEKKPCGEYYDYICKNYGNNEFDPIEIIKKLKGNSADVRWLLINCELAQTKEMLDFYKSFNPTATNISALISSCKYTQTVEMLKYYVDSQPDEYDVHWLIGSCKLAKEYFNKGEIKL